MLQLLGVCNIKNLCNYFSFHIVIYFVVIYEFLHLKLVLFVFKFFIIVLFFIGIDLICPTANLS